VRKARQVFSTKPVFRFVTSDSVESEIVEHAEEIYVMTIWMLHICSLFKSFIIMLDCLKPVKATDTSGSQTRQYSALVEQAWQQSDNKNPLSSVLKNQLWLTIQPTVVISACILNHTEIVGKNRRM